MIAKASQSHRAIPWRSLAQMNEIETFFGLVEDTADALRVFELCRQGRLGRVRRRLHEKERRLIRSGSVFVFDEQESGIRRWTDGRLWSPSRILGNFLIYRELERKVTSIMPSSADGSRSSLKRLQPDTGRDAERRLQETPTNLAAILPWLPTPVIPNEDEHDSLCMGVDPNKVIDYGSVTFGVNSSSERCAASLLGPNSFRLLKSKKLQASSGSANGSQTRYVFKPDGLIKKTISARVDSRMQHLVCYFNEHDFIFTHSGSARPDRAFAANPLMEELRRTRIPADLVLQQNFRKPPTTELGFPLFEHAARGKRKHPMSMAHAGGRDFGVQPIYPRMQPDLSALDLTNSWSQFTASSSDEVAMLPDSGETDILGETDNQHTPGFEQSADPSNGALMEECLRIVLSDMHSTAEHSHTPGLLIRSDDPAMPIVERPDSIPPHFQP